MATMTFDPATWLKDFISVGGAYLGSGNRITFCWAVHGWPTEETIRARELYDVLSNDPAKRTAVVGHLKARLPQEVEL